MSTNKHQMPVNWPQALEIHKAYTQGIDMIALAIEHNIPEREVYEIIEWVNVLDPATAHPAPRPAPAVTQAQKPAVATDVQPPAQKPAYVQKRGPYKTRVRDAQPEPDAPRQKPFVRPAAQYSNSTPYGMAQELMDAGGKSAYTKKKGMRSTGGGMPTVKLAKITIQNHK